MWLAEHHSRTEQGSDSQRTGASNILGLSFKSSRRLQAKTERQAALRRVILKHAQLKGLSLRLRAEPDGECRSEQNREERRAEQGIKEFDFDR